uniref:C-type lectin domain-containing protein n=1 Tax=Fundulus heteroclitus TaxID=8078 RepID=A0A3Q2PS15_FUNHE
CGNFMFISQVITLVPDSVVVITHRAVFRLSGLLAVVDLQSDQTIQQFRYVGLMKNWNDAQAYCRERSTYTDLSSIRSYADNYAMYVILWGLPYGSSSWIGLHRSDWVWSDGSISSYTALGLQRSPEQANCVMVDGSGTWVSRPCSESYGFLCSTGEFSFSFPAGCSPAELIRCFWVSLQTSYLP